LPSRRDWNYLDKTIGKDGGKKLKARIHWDRYKDGRNGHGTDNYGFSALPSGARGPEGDFFGADYDYEAGYWWTSATYEDSNAYCWYIVDHDAELCENSPRNKGYGFSVRCVQDL